MNRAVKLIETGEALEQYPISVDERLDAHAFVKWMHHRWMSSRTFKLASWEAQGMARALFDMAQSESPVGTLPDDDAELAYMLRVHPHQMAELRRAEFGPLRGWHRCLCGNVVRLMHKVVLEQVQDAIERRDTRALSADGKAEYQRIKRLREALKGLGLDDAVLADDHLIARMDAWLKENRKGRRNPAAYEAVMIAAARGQWFAPSPQQ